MSGDVRMVWFARKGGREAVGISWALCDRHRRLQRVPFDRDLITADVKGLVCEECVKEKDRTERIDATWRKGEPIDKRRAR